MRPDASFVLYVLLMVAVFGSSSTLSQREGAHFVAFGTGARDVGDSNVSDCANLLLYSADPNHIWNRIHRRLLERHDAQGKTWGCDDVDPLLWRESKHVLAGSAYRETVHLLDEFTSTHAERLISNSLQRAVFQRDLWAVFDWLALRNDTHAQERAGLERRLAAIIRAVALTSNEIKRLPDDYAQLRESTPSDGLVLPGTAGGWLLIGRDDATPIAPFHSVTFPRSLFLVYLRLPPGGPDATNYLETMRAYSQKRSHGDDCMLHRCSPPQFPVGTELALVRRALLIDAAGQPVLSPITESVQLRQYREIPEAFTIDGGRLTQTDEFQFTRRRLFEGKILLRGVGENEQQFRVFASHEMDYFEGQPGGRITVLKSCHACHQGVGVISFTSYSRVQFEHDRFFILVHASTEAQESAAALGYLQRSDSWRLLQKLMRPGI